MRFCRAMKGDSMIDAGIPSGGTVVVEKRSSANVGHIVVAIIDNEFTLKRLGREREKRQIVLRPENKAYPGIRPKGDLEIFGVVAGTVSEVLTRGAYRTALDAMADQV